MAYQDYNIGRVLAVLDEVGETNNTVTVVFGDVSLCRLCILYSIMTLPRLMLLAARVAVRRAQPVGKDVVV